MQNLTRITFDPNVMGGKPCIRGLRVTVGAIVGLVAAGYSTDEILKAYPYLEAADVRDALSYAAWRVEEREYPGMTWDQFITLAVAEKTSAIATEEYLEFRAKRASKEKFLAAMAKVADVEPA